jgi:hypothetical protein
LIRFKAEEDVMHPLGNIDHQSRDGAAQGSDNRADQNENDGVVAQCLAKADTEKIGDGNGPSEGSRPTLKRGVEHQGKRALRGE